MGASRTIGSLALLFVLAQAGQTQEYLLLEKHQPGDFYRCHLSLNLTGQMQVIKEDKAVQLPLTATAEHVFIDRTLSATPLGAIQKVARYYDTAKATITVQSDKSERTLRGERQLMVAQHCKGEGLIYCPVGSLTPEELELTEHLDVLSLPGLLPGKEVKVGDTWTINNEAAQFICHFDGLTSQDLQAKLDAVQDHVARISLHGSANGIDLGAITKLTIDATARFDLNTHSIVALEWKQRDERGQGPASPATTVESTTTLQREALQEADDHLSNIALVPVPDGFEPPASMLLVAYHHAEKTPFDLFFARDWQLVGRTAEHVVLRLLDRGDFVAQVTITPWDKAKSRNHLTPDEFREAMAKTPGWEQGDIVEDGEVPPIDGGDQWIYHIKASGQMDGIKVVQNFYLVASPTGEQVVLAFTMNPNQVEKLGTRDLALVRSLEFNKEDK